MKKIALFLSLTIFSLGSFSLINSSKVKAAYPISKPAANVEHQNELSFQSTHGKSSKIERVNKEVNRKITLSQKAEKNEGKKSQIIAAVLCFLVGALGVHRFYLGYTVVGILQILTLGGCGIWTLIDLVRILTGDLQPKDGSEYRDKIE